MADDNVVDIGSFKQKNETVWECYCGCQLFYVLDTYRFRCYECNTIFNIDDENE